MPEKEERGLTAESGGEFETYIVTGLLRLMRRMPYESIKITDIVREAGVSRMTYYRHFKSKSDVLVSLVEYIIRSVNPVCHENRRNGDWYRFWLTLFDYADRYASALKRSSTRDSAISFWNVSTAPPFRICRRRNRRRPPIGCIFSPGGCTTSSSPG